MSFNFSELAEHDQRLINNFIHLARIDSPSRHESSMAQEVIKQLEALGFEAYIDNSAGTTGSDTGNVIAYKKGRGSGKLVLSAHLDCVDPCIGIEPYIDDEGIIRSKGQTILSSDDKSGIACILEACKRLFEGQQAYPDILITFTTQEEVGLCGAKALDSSLFNGEIALVLDGDQKPGGICIGAPFHYTYTAEFIGKAAHAGVCPEEGISAIALCAQALSKIPQGRIDSETTANIGTIEGGRAGNIVAPSCKVLGEFRSLNKDKVEPLKELIDSTFKEVVQQGGGQLTIEWDYEYAGYHLREDDPVVLLLKDAAYDAGLSFSAQLSGGGSDANVLAGKGAVPVVLGTGMKGFHTVDESIAVQDLIDTTRYVQAIAYRIASQAS